MVPVSKEELVLMSKGASAMDWEMTFLLIVVVSFLGVFYLWKWGLDADPHSDKDSWKFTNPGGGGV
jgi:predicted MFS family arabinose efflux permease